jgi:hypothetical protein
VADLLARDAPWAGAPAAVAVAKRPTATAGPGRSTTSRSGTAGSGSARYGSSARYGTGPSGGPSSASRAGSRPEDGRRLRQFVDAAWSPQWRFVTIAAAVLLAGLMANGVMLVTFSGPSHSATAESDEGGYPADDTDPNAASRTYDDNGRPIDSALTPMFASPASAAVAQPGVGLPLALTSLGTAAPAVSPTGTTVLRGVPVASAPVRAVAPGTSGTGTGIGSVTTSSKSGSAVGNLVRDTASDLGKTVDDTASGLGKTLKKTATGLGDTVGDVADGLLGSGSSSRSRTGSSRNDSSNGSKSTSNRGLVGNLLGR